MFIENLEETINLGKNFAKGLEPLSVVLLKGPIGAGKTSFVKGIAIGLEIKEDITSPTFALSHHYYSGIITLIHLDLYRLENISMAREFFFAEQEEAHQNKAILVVEWPDLIKPIIDNYWEIEINYTENLGRNYEISDPKY